MVAHRAVLTASAAAAVEDYSVGSAMTKMRMMMVAAAPVGAMVAADFGSLAFCLEGRRLRSTFSGWVVLVSLCRWYSLETDNLLIDIADGADCRGGFCSPGASNVFF